MRDGRVLTMNEADVIAEAQEATVAAWRRLHEQSPDIEMPLSMRRYGKRKAKDDAASNDRNHSICRACCIAGRRTAGSAPLVFDIPRSGSDYPRDFHSPAPFDAVRRSVSDVCRGPLRPGAGPRRDLALCALPERLHRRQPARARRRPGLGSIGDWPEPLEPSDKAVRGMGLIPRVCGKGDVALHAIRRSAPPICSIGSTRIIGPTTTGCATSSPVSSPEHGVAFHVSCHSMSSVGGAAIGGLRAGSGRISTSARGTARRRTRISPRRSSIA